MLETAPLVPTFEVNQIAKIIHTRDNGTELPNVRNFNHALRHAIPSVEFVVDLRSHDFGEIEYELARTRPVIPWLLMHEAGRDFEHTVVVTGYDRVNQRIMVNDPRTGSGPSDMEVTRFIENWEGTERTLIKLKVNQKVQRMLTEWVEERTREERIEEVEKLAGT